MSKVTLKDVYELVESLDNKLDKRFTKIEERVDKLEDFKAMLVGMGVIISLFVGGLINYIWQKITGK